MIETILDYIQYNKGYLGIYDATGRKRVPRFSAITGIDTIRLRNQAHDRPSGFAACLVGALAVVADAVLAFTGAAVFLTALTPGLTAGADLIGSALLAAVTGFFGGGCDLGSVVGCFETGFAAALVVAFLGASNTFFCVPTVLLVVVKTFEGDLGGAEYTFGAVTPSLPWAAPLPRPRGLLAVCARTAPAFVQSMIELP